MLPVSEAQRRLVAAVGAVEVEVVPVDAAFGRVLAEDVVAEADVPAWRSSAMDGYAVRAADLGAAGGVLPLADVLLAGGWRSGPLPEGAAAAVMTGAPVPEGADAVIPIEQSDRSMRGEVRLTAGTMPGRFVRAAGSDVAAGATVLAAGTALTPAAVALLASVGRREVRVGRRPVVVVVTTGDEVVRDGPLRPGQLRSSNHLALRGLIEEAGAVAVDGGHAPDDPAALRAVFEAAMAHADVVVSTGGVSAGTADHVRPTWAALGVTELLYKVRMKPGMPVLAGTATSGDRRVLLVGMTGNPVSTAVTFQQLVRPALRARMGDRAPYLGLLQAVAAEDLPSAAGRARFERVELSLVGGRLELRRPREQSSHVLSGLATAGAFVLLGPDSPGLVAGELAWVQPIGGAVPPRTDPGFDW